jgi:hypothetical protein
LDCPKDGRSLALVGQVGLVGLCQTWECGGVLQGFFQFSFFGIRQSLPTKTADKVKAKAGCRRGNHVTLAVTVSSSDIVDYFFETNRFSGWHLSLCGYHFK